MIPRDLFLLLIRKFRFIFNISCIFKSTRCSYLIRYRFKDGMVLLGVTNSAMLYGQSSIG